MRAGVVLVPVHESKTIEVRSLAVTTLEEALAAFRDAPSSVIANAVVALGAAALEGHTPPKQRQNLDFHKAWKVEAAKPRALTWCLSTLTAQLPRLSGGDYFGEQSDGLVDRLKCLQQLEPDPRIGRAVLALLVLDPPVVGTVDVQAALMETLARHADDGTYAAASESLEAALFGNDGVPPLASLRRPTVALTAQQRAKWQRPKAAPPRAVTELWNAVWAHPADDAPKEVLSDALQEQGDPRGEFIALQLREHRGLATDDEVKRAQTLAKEHGKAWLGPLRAVAYRAEFRRGFLWRLELQGRWASRSWATLAKEPSLATVEELVAGKAVDDIFMPFFESGVMRNARHLDLGSNEVLAMVKRLEWPTLESVSFLEWKGIRFSEDRFDQKVTSEVLPFVEQRTSVTKVVCHSGFVSQFSKGLRERLTAFGCRDELPVALKTWRLLPNADRLACEWPERIELDRRAPSVARVTPSSGSLDAKKLLQQLPKAVKTVEVVGNATLARDLATAFGKRMKFVARPLPSGLVTNPKG